MQPGIYPDISNEAYHIGPGISKTGLKLIEKSPKTFHAITTGAVPKKETIFKDLGKALHALVLEKHVFDKTYCKPLTLEAAERQGIKVLDSSEKIQAMVSDLNQIKAAEMEEQGIISTPEQLVEMINELNKTRLPKLSTTGNKAELIARIMAEAEQGEEHADAVTYGELSAMKGPELKAEIERINQKRDGLLSTSGSRAELAQRLRDNGVDVCCSWEVIAAYQEQTGRPYMLSSGHSKAEMVDWLNAEKYKGGGWRTWDQVRAEWAENNPDRIILTEEEWTKIHAMRDALMAHPWARKLLWPEKGGKAEESIYWIDKKTGELCRCRTDWRRYDGLPVDLKSCNDASEEGFKKAVETYGYDMQEQFYLDGLEAATGVRPKCMPFVCVESEAPHLVQVHILDEAYQMIGYGRYRAALDRYHACKEANDWPGYPEELNKLTPRRFYMTQYQHYLPEEF